MTGSILKLTRCICTLALVAVVWSAAPALAQGLSEPNESALRALSAVAVKALQPLIERADAEDRKNFGESVSSHDLFDHYRISAEDGDGTAQTTLGLLYGKGLGVARDLISAHKWFSIASDQDAEDAAIYRDLVAKLMTRAEIAEAKGLAREWHESQMN